MTGCQQGSTPDDRAPEPGVQDLQIRGEGPHHADRQPVLAAPQGAQVLAQQRWQHVQAAVHQIDGGAPRKGLSIEERTLLQGVTLLWGLLRWIEEFLHRITFSYHILV